MIKKVDQEVLRNLLAVAEIAIDENWQSMVTEGFGDHQRAVDVERADLSSKLGDDETKVEVELKNHFTRNAAQTVEGWLYARLSENAIDIELFEGEFKDPQTLQVTLAAKGAEAAKAAASEYDLDFNSSEIQR